jgi:hypothetical protein
VLKERPATARIPIILSTSVNLDALTEAKVRQLQLEGRVEMPVSSGELIEVISLILLRQKPVATVQKEQIEEGVARVVWPRVERPAPPPEPEKPPAPPRTVKPVVWPQAGKRKEGGEKAPAEAGSIPPLAPPKPSGREHRARLAMLASGQLQPEQDPDQKSEARSQKSDKAPAPAPPAKGQNNPYLSRAPRQGSRQPPSKPADPESGTRDPTYEDRVKALLRYVDKPAQESAPSKGFQAMPLAQADPARIVDFTRKKKDPDPPAKQQHPSPEKKGGRASPGSSRGREKGGEQDPVIRPVLWTQIKKKE